MRKATRGYRWLKRQPNVKPCPLCGSTWLSMSRLTYHWWDRFFVSCENCHYCGKTTFSRKTALRKWNRIARREKETEGER